MIDKPITLVDEIKERDYRGNNHHEFYKPDDSSIESFVVLKTIFLSVELFICFIFRRIHLASYSLINADDKISSTSSS